MAVILNQITVGDLRILVLNSAPNTGSGISVELGSLAMIQGETGIWQKTGAGSTDWKLSSIDAAQLGLDLADFDSRISTLELDPVTKSYVDGADQTLQGNIDSEASARQLGDETLQGNIDAEATARQLGDSTLQGNIDSEASARQLGDETLQGNIDQEVMDRMSADTTLQNNIDSEASARQSADETLQGNIDQEVADREAAVSALQSTLESIIGGLDLGDLTDVTISTPMPGDLVRYDGSQWLNESPIDTSDGAGGGGGGGGYLPEIMVGPTFGGAATWSQDYIPGYSGSADKTQMATRFIATAMTVSRVSFNVINATNASDAVLVAKIYDTWGADSFGTLIGQSSSISVSSIPNIGLTQIDLDFVPSFSLNMGEQYWLELSIQSGTLDKDNFSVEMGNEPSFNNSNTSSAYWSNDFGVTKVFTNSNSGTTFGPAFTLWSFAGGGAGGGSSDNKIIKTNANGRLDSTFLQYNVDFGNNMLSGVASPMMPTDAANKDYVDNQINSEASARQSGDSSTLSSAQAYADQKVADLVNSAPAVLDTLQELAAALGDDPNFATTIAGQIGDLDSRLDNLESDQVTKSYVDAADSALDSRLDALELDPVTKTYVDAADSSLDSRLDSLEADPVTKTYVDSADSALDGRLDILEADPVTKTYVDSSDSALDGRLDILEVDPVTKTYVDAADLGLANRIAALETYDQETVYIDNVNGVDEAGRGSMLRPFKTINYAYSQVESLGNPSNNAYNANVGRFVTEKLVMHLAPGRYQENVVLGFKRARVRLTGDGATIVGDVKMSVKLSDFPASNLENIKASFPTPYTGASAFMNFELVGKSGGGLESDPTANVLVVTGQVALAFEESTVPGSGVIFPNWDGSFGQFYSYLRGASVGNFVVTTSHSAATPTLPAGVIEVDSCNIATTATTYRMHTGIVPYSYLTDYANWTVASKGSTNKAPTGTWTLKAHNSTFGNVIGPRLTIGEMDGCRIYDIDRSMRGTVDNGGVAGSTSTSYVGFVNNQFRIYSGAGDLASAYKIGQASGSTRYKIDSVSYTTLAFSRNSSGVLSARTLDVGAGVSYDLLDDARSVFVNDSATNYTRTSNTVDSALEGIDAELGNKASTTYVQQQDALKVSKAGDTMSGALAMGSNKITNLADPTAAQDAATKAYVDSKDAATLSSAQSYADQKVSALVNSAPAVLDTLKELADALGGDANFAATVAGQIGAVDDRVDQEILDRAAADDLKLDLAGGTMSGDINMGSNDLVSVGAIGLGSASPESIFELVDNNVKYNIKGYSTSTTGAVNAVIASIAPAADTVTVLKVMITGMDSSSKDSITYERTVRVKNQGGTISLGTVQSDYTSEDMSLSDADCTILVNASNVDVRVTGVDAKTISWKCLLQKMV